MKIFVTVEPRGEAQSARREMESKLFYDVVIEMVMCTLS